MPAVASGTSEQAQFLAALRSRRLLVASGVPGVYGHSGEFDDVCDGVARLVSRAVAGERPERLCFPPVLPRHDLESVGYLKSFPHLAGSIFAFSGDEAGAAEQHERAARHEDWSEFQAMTDLVLTPAACYPVYPAIAARGQLAAGGITIDAGSAYVFRREPSEDPGRLQIFHQRELVRIGEPQTVVDWRLRWRDRAVVLISSLGLEPQVDVATDPFMGRGGRMLAASQRQQELKFELSVPIAGAPHAVASFNYHQDHFACAYGLELAGGEPVHTACLGFGLERIALALFAKHGLEVAAWPQAVRAELW